MISPPLPVGTYVEWSENSLEPLAVGAVVVEAAAPLTYITNAARVEISTETKSKQIVMVVFWTTDSLPGIPTCPGDLIVILTAPQGAGEETGGAVRDPPI